MVVRWISVVSICATFLLQGCKIPPPEKPENMLSEEQMATILADVYLAEGARMGGTRMYDGKNIADYYEVIYQKYGITKDQFIESYAFYSTYPEIMIAIHDRSIRTLNEWDAYVKGEMAENAKHDTIPENDTNATPSFIEGFDSLDHP